jgi:hypothetical protein
VYVTLASIDLLLVLSIAVATVVASGRAKRLALVPTPGRRRLRALGGSIALSFAGAFVMLRTFTDVAMFVALDRALVRELPLTAAASMLPVAAAVVMSGPRLRALADGAEPDDAAVTDPRLVVPVRVAAVAALLGVWYWFVPPAAPYWDDLALAMGVLAAAATLLSLAQRRAHHRATAGQVPSSTTRVTTLVPLAALLAIVPLALSVTADKRLVGQAVADDEFVIGQSLTLSGITPGVVPTVNGQVQADADTVHVMSDALGTVTLVNRSYEDRLVDLTDVNARVLERDGHSVPVQSLYLKPGETYQLTFEAPVD